eukprot:scaffold45569_cov28-Tisochrysis_lutea.AAC.1
MPESCAMGLGTNMPNLRLSRTPCPSSPLLSGPVARSTPHEKIWPSLSTISECHDPAESGTEGEFLLRSAARRSGRLDLTSGGNCDGVQPPTALARAVRAAWRRGWRDFAVAWRAWSEEGGRKERR